MNFTDPSGHSECGVGQYHCKGDVDRFALMKNQYEQGDDLVFGLPGSAGVNRYVEVKITVGTIAIVIPFNLYGGGESEVDILGIGIESGIGGYFGTGGEITGILDISSFGSPHLAPRFEIERGAGLGVTIAGLSGTGKRAIISHNDGTESQELGLELIVAGGSAGVTYDPNAIIVRPSERLARNLAEGDNDAWQRVWESLYGSSSVLPSSNYIFINTIHADPVFSDYGGKNIFVTLREIN